MSRHDEAREQPEDAVDAAAAGEALSRINSGEAPIPLSELRAELEVVWAAEAFARGEVEYDETAPVELPPAPDTKPTDTRGVRPPLNPHQQRPGRKES